MPDTPLPPTHGIAYVGCNLCGAHDTRQRYTVTVRPDQRGVYGQDSWPIVQCRRCGLIYANPRPDAAALEAYYHFANPWDAQYVQDWFITNADLQRPTWRRFLAAMQRFGSPGRLLDVGCGAGSFLVEARAAGFEVLGQEVAPYFIGYARQQHQLTIYAGEIETLPLAPHSLDYVTAFDVIEHHPDPAQLVRAMHRLLRPGGIVALSTHDIGNFFARLYGARWRYLNPVGHLTYFTRATLRALLEQHGFRILYAGGIHTADGSRLAEWRNYILQFGRVVLGRALILGVYKPAAQHWPALTRWRITTRVGVLNHPKLLMRAGSQIVMNDDMLMLAVAL